MFAVIKTGGKQYKVQMGDTLRVEKLAADAGETVMFGDIMMLGGDSPVVGAPFVEDAGVKAEVLDQIRGEKVIHYVRRRRKHSSKRTKGHRQYLTLVKVTEIMAKGAGKAGVKAAIGAGAAPAASTSAEPKAKAKAEPKAKAAPKADAKKTETKKADAPAGADDLKQLSGVGPALEKKLHEAGVTTFAQIAAWTEADVAEMDEKLSFKGRIEREGWIEQAKELAAKG